MIDVEAVTQFLQLHFDPSIFDVVHIGAGMFSQAFVFKLAQEEFVIRLNPYEEDFLKDKFADQHFSNKIPVPKMIACDRFDQNYYFAITETCPGRTLNVLEEQIVLEILPNLFEALLALHTFDTSSYTGWGLTNANGHGRFASWEEYLLSFYNQKFAFTWEELFDRTCMEQEVYEKYLSTLQHYLPFCVTDKYWIHGDFGFDNVMSHGKQITGVLDWAESRLGDFVYDIAYLEFWSKKIPYKKLWLEWAKCQRLSIANFKERMWCYGIHIGLSSLAIAAIQGDIGDYNQIKVRLESLVPSF